MLSDGSAILEAIPNPIIIANHDKTIAQVNGPAEELFSCSREHLLGRSIEELVSEHSRTQYRESFAELLQKPGKRMLQLQALSKGGRIFPVEVNLSRLKAEGGFSVLNAFRCPDAEPYPPENGPWASGKLCCELSENTDDILFTLDLDGRCTSLNKAAERISGYSHAEASGRNILKAVPLDNRRKFRELLSKAAAGESVRSFEVEMVAKDGRRIPMEVHAKALFRDGKPVGVQGIARDDSERRLLQKQLIQAQKMEAVGRLASGVAHDFNNLLTIISCYSDLLLGEIHPGDPKLKYVEQIKEAGKKGSRLALQLLAFSRRQTRSPKILDINMLVSQSAKTLGRFLENKIRVEVSLSPDLGMIKADPGQIEQIILNLAIHADDSMPDGGVLSISTRNTDLDESYAASHVGAPCGSFITLEMSDTGRGMDPETQVHLFEPFYSAKKEGKGTGLSLAAVYGIVKQNGGYIWVDSAPGRGTRATIHLPRTEEAFCPNRPVESPPGGGPATLLLVEDEDSVRNILTRILKASGYNVLIAKDSEEALSIARNYEKTIDLMIADVSIPEKNGHELARAFSRWKPATKVLYISGHAEDALVQHGISDPERHFLLKPFQRDQLITKVHSLLSQ